MDSECFKGNDSSFALALIGRFILGLEKNDDKVSHRNLSASMQASKVKILFQSS